MKQGTESSPLRSRTALVLGGRGFIGAQIVARLRSAGWRVICAQRRADPHDPDLRVLDLDRNLAPAEIQAAIQGVDAVVNAAGILREGRSQHFERIHHEGPLALARGCADLGGIDFVQISALGMPADGAFIASKHRFDSELMLLPLRAVVLRPSVVYSTRGSFGGTTLLRALSSIPLVQPLPGDGEQRIQPVAAEDLAELVLRALQSEVRGVFELGCREPVSVRDYLCAWRRWMQVGGLRCLRIPNALISLAAELMEHFGRGPLGRTIWRMLRRGNVCEAGAHARLEHVFGFAPRDLDTVLQSNPSQVQDRAFARLSLIDPLLRLGLVVLFAISGWVGITSPPAQIEAMTRGTILASVDAVLLARGSGVVDLVLCLWLLSGWRRTAAVLAMLVLVAGYTLVLGLAVPGSWLDPLGGMAKNLVVLPALAVAWITSGHRR